MKTKRNTLLAKLHILLKELNAEEFKKDLYAPYGATSSKGMSDGQIADLVAKLKAHRDIQRDEAVRTLRSNALRLLTDMGVYYVGPGEDQDACWQRVNEFLEQDKIAGKTLYQMNIPELNKLIRQLRSLKDKGYRYQVAEIHPAKMPEVEPQPLREVVFMSMPTDNIAN